jgi:parvulin-like peptidyl-prolyl isomerase
MNALVGFLRKTACAVSIGMVFVHAAAAQRHGEVAVEAGEPIVVVGKSAVTLPEFELAARQSMRQKYYHGSAPQAELVALLRDVANQIVNRGLLQAEAARLGIQPDADKVKAEVDAMDGRYRDSPRWKQDRDAMLARLVPELEQRSILDRLERSVRGVAPATDVEARSYYDAKPELFTEPEKLRLFMILLSVDPSSPKPVWAKAEEEAQAIYKRLQAGADFAELARIHSGDESGQRGGDVGYVHRGMMPEELQQKIDSYQVGVLQLPLVTLRGVALFRVDERVVARLRTFDEIKARAAELLQRERGEKAWQALIAKLRAESSFNIREDRFAEIAGRLVSAPAPGATN